MREEKAYPKGEVYMDTHFNGYLLGFGYLASIPPSFCNLNFLCGNIPHQLENFWYKSG